VNSKQENLCLQLKNRRITMGKKLEDVASTITQDFTPRKGVFFAAYPASGDSMTLTMRRPMGTALLESVSRLTFWK
jgi:hypothetical protein